MTDGFFKIYMLTLLPFVVIDGIWLGFVAPGFYRSQIGFLLAERPNWFAAVLFYLLFIAGMVYFVTGLDISLSSALIRGAIFGFMCYATYDLTNLATVKGWPVLVTVVDLCWGTILGGGTASLAVLMKGLFQ